MRLNIAMAPGPLGRGTGPDPGRLLIAEEERYPLRATKLQMRKVVAVQEVGLSRFESFHEPVTGFQKPARVSDCLNVPLRLSGNRHTFE